MKRATAIIIMIYYVVPIWSSNNEEQSSSNSSSISISTSTTTSAASTILGTVLRQNEMDRSRHSSSSMTEVSDSNPVWRRFCREHAIEGMHKQRLEESLAASLTNSRLKRTESQTLITEISRQLSDVPSYPQEHQRRLSTLVQSQRVQELGSLILKLLAENNEDQKQLIAENANILKTTQDMLASSEYESTRNNRRAKIALALSVITGAWGIFASVYFNK